MNVRVSVDRGGEELRKQSRNTGASDSGNRSNDNVNWVAIAGIGGAKEGVAKAIAEKEVTITVIGGAIAIALQRFRVIFIRNSIRW